MENIKKTSVKDIEKKAVFFHLLHKKTITGAIAKSYLKMLNKERNTSNKFEFRFVYGEFWFSTSIDTLENFNRSIKLFHKINRNTNLNHFPTKGCISIINYKTSDNTFNFWNILCLSFEDRNSQYDRIKNLNWSGVVIDNSVVEYLKEQKQIPNYYLAKFAIKYLVPYVAGNRKKEPEFALKFFNKKLNYKELKETCKKIEDTSLKYNKKTNKSAKKRVNNTIDFLKFCQK